MTADPVLFDVARSVAPRRLHVVVRMAFLLALGSIGCSSIYWLLYLSLPAVAALLILQKDGARYLAEDAPAMLLLLRKVAAVYAYLWLLTDSVSWGGRAFAVTFEVRTEGTPSATSALSRLVLSVPALIVLVALSFIGSVLWVVGALYILMKERLPDLVRDFLKLTLRYQFRLIAYHLSLVERYPSLEDGSMSSTAGPRPA